MLHILKKKTTTLLAMLRFATIRLFLLTLKLMEMAECTWIGIKQYLGDMSKPSYVFSMSKVFFIIQNKQRS